MKENSKANKLLWIVVGVTILTALGYYGRPRHNTVPDELIGVWKTDTPQYADRFFEINLVSISFGTGGGTGSIGFIREITAIPGANGETLYKFTYMEDEKELECSFYYEPGKKQKIRFKSQPKIVWTKESAD